MYLYVFVESCTSLFNSFSFFMRKRELLRGMWQYIIIRANVTENGNIIAYLHVSYCLVLSLVIFLNLVSFFVLRHSLYV